MYVGENYDIIGLDDDLAPVGCQAIINTNVDLSIWPHNGMKWKLGSIAFILENGLHNSGPGFIELTNLHQRSK